VLGRVIEVVSGQSLYQFEKQRLRDPLGMTETAFYVSNTTLTAVNAADAICGHWKIGLPCELMLL